MYCTRKLGIFFAYCEHHAMFWRSFYAGFIKAFSNEPLHWPISDQSVVRGLSVGASLPLFPALVSRTWLAQTYIKRYSMVEPGVYEANQWEGKQ